MFFFKKKNKKNLSFLQKSLRIPIFANHQNWNAYALPSWRKFAKFAKKLYPPKFLTERYAVNKTKIYLWIVSKFCFSYWANSSIIMSFTIPPEIIWKPFWFSGDFRVSTSLLICSNLLNFRSDIRLRSLSFCLVVSCFFLFEVLFLLLVYWPNPSQSSTSIPLKTPENFWYPNVFRRCRNGERWLEMDWYNVTYKCVIHNHGDTILNLA